jgi:hypothetical protein
VHNTQPGTTSFYTAKQPAARYNLVDEEYGVSYGAYREAEPDTYYWRIAHFLFPFYTMTPVGALGVRKQVRAWVPMDDEHTLYFSMAEPASRTDVANGPPTHEQPRTSGWYGRYQARATVENDYEIDREAQSSMQSYSGLPSITIQDQAVTESMGTIYDRSHEHLGTSDSMIIRTRRRLIEAAKAFAGAGHCPARRRQAVHLRPAFWRGHPAEVVGLVAGHREPPKGLHGAGRQAAAKNGGDGLIVSSADERRGRQYCSRPLLISFGSAMPCPAVAWSCPATS